MIMILHFVGGLGGTVAWATTYPVDVVKTIFQQSDTPSTTPSLAGPMSKLYKDHGNTTLIYKYIYIGYDQ